MNGLAGPLLIRMRFRGDSVKLVENTRGSRTLMSALSSLLNKRDSLATTVESRVAIQSTWTDFGAGFWATFGANFWATFLDAIQ